MIQARTFKERAYFPGASSKKVITLDAVDIEKMHRNQTLDEGLKRFGLDFNRLAQRLVALAPTLDAALQPTITTPTITNLIQFFQNFLPGLVHAATAARNIDKIVGMSTMGAFEDEEVVQGILELTGGAVPYGDYTNVPLASWNPNWNRYTNIRFEQGLTVPLLEEMRAARMGISSGTSKRNSAVIQLEIARNRTGFFGFNNGLNRTYGFLNDPGLPAYVPAANGASSSPLWANKTMLEIEADILQMITGIQTQTQSFIDPREEVLTLAVADAVVNFLNVPTQFGYSTQVWLNDNYPKIRVVSAPELTLANGGQNVAYLFADQVKDDSTDDKRTFMQVVPMKFMALGVEQKSKGYLEDYANATCGVFCKRPYAVYRLTHI